MSLFLFCTNTLVVMLTMTALWLASVRLANASIVDPFWSVLFLAIATNTACRTGLGPKKLVVLGLVALWATRLFLHLFVRGLRKPEDPRYQAFRKRFGAERYWWVSFFQVFLLQGVLALIVSAPLQLATSATPSGSFGPFDLLGLVLFVVGFTVETVADAQLQRFRDDPKMRGRILDSGLWGRSRHPNYFGEAVLWWGFGCFAISEPFGLVALLAPALMTFLLLRVSGVTMLDAHLTQTRPGYAAYVAKTPAFVPRLGR